MGYLGNYKVSPCRSEQLHIQAVSCMIQGGSSSNCLLYSYVSVIYVLHNSLPDHV